MLIARSAWLPRSARICPSHVSHVSYDAHMKIVGRNFEFLAAPCFIFLDDPFCLIMVNPDETVTCECLYTAGGDTRAKDYFSIPNIHEIDEEDSETEETGTTEQTNCSSLAKKDESTTAETQNVLDNEAVYTEDSFCSGESCDEGSCTDVTPRSLTSSLPCLADVQRSQSSNEREIDESKWEDDGSYSLGDHQPARAATASRLVKPRKCRRWNMTFTDDEMRKIERENELLLRKIMAQQKPRHRIVDEHTTAQPRTSSSAINRKKLQKKIESDNMVRKSLLDFR